MKYLSKEIQLIWGNSEVRSMEEGIQHMEPIRGKICHKAAMGLHAVRSVFPNPDTGLVPG